jgi:CRP/FNR family transcriptional regulator, cyclic AMP receptor protein
MRRDLIYLQDFAVTRGMSEDGLARLHESLVPQTLAVGAQLCVENEPSEYLYFLREGAVSVTKRARDGRDHEIVVLTAPTLIGELELIDGMPASATVVAKSVVLASLLPSASYDRLVNHHPAIMAHFNRNLARVLARRLYATNNELAGLVAPDREPELRVAQTTIGTQWQFGPV